MFRIDRKTVDKMVAEALPEHPAETGPTPAKKKEQKSKKRKEPHVPPDEIGIEQFLDVDLRVATVVNAEHIDGADRLLKITVDLGTETRTVFAGIRSDYAPEDLIGKQVVVVANLKPRKMKFGMSEGMILAAAGDGRPFVIGVDDGATAGMRVR